VPTKPSKKSSISWRQPDTADPSPLPENQPIPLRSTAVSISILTSHATALLNSPSQGFSNQEPRPTTPRLGPTKTSSQIPRSCPAN
jgi:hypothetical protein